MNDPRKRESVFVDLDDAFRDHHENDGLGKTHADLDDLTDHHDPEEEEPDPQAS